MAHRTWVLKGCLVRGARRVSLQLDIAGEMTRWVEMSFSAAHTAAFFREAVTHGVVFAIRDEGGFPAPLNSSGVRSMPFWSLESRAMKVIANVPAYAGFEPVAVTLDDFRSRWLPGLVDDGIHVGINWSGHAATGYDLAPDDVLWRLTHNQAEATRSSGQTHDM